MNRPLKGSCLCGKVKFEVNSFNPQVAHCHCSMCRKFHGAAFATLAAVPAVDFHWTEGMQRLKRFTAHNGTERTFCSSCGSSLTFTTPKSDARVVEVALGAMDQPVPVRADAHIFTGSGSDWYKKSDDLPHYEQWRDSKVLDD